MYETGQGVPVDQTQARSHYERAAEVGVGVSSAIQKMGERYRDGRGVPADPVTAYTWFAIGARMGAPESEGSLDLHQPRENGRVASMVKERFK